MVAFSSDKLGSDVRRPIRSATETSQDVWAELETGGMGVMQAIQGALFLLVSQRLC